MIKKKAQTLVSLVLVALLLGNQFVLAFLRSVQEVSLADDAYHFRYFADGRNDENYIEWWYFNFFDAAQDIQAIFTYFVADPMNRSRRGWSQIAAVVYTSQSTVSAIDEYPLDAFSASYERADVQIMSHRIEVIDEQTYRIIGSTKDGKLSWDLTYVRQAASWLGGDRIPVGLFPWEKMSWLIYMPGANVSGRLEVEDRVFTISCTGYHDHNWGEWIPPNARWNWAQYFGPGLALEMGDFIGRKVGLVSIDVHGEQTAFTKSQYQLTHSQWQSDPQNQTRYPLETTLRAETSTHRLTLRMQVVRTHDLRGDLPFPLPDVIVYEQPAQFEGELLKKGPDGNWRHVVSFNGRGFKEYTALSF